MMDYEKNVMDLSLHFLRRGYPEELILEAITITRQLDRHLLLQTVEKELKKYPDNIFLINTFHPSDYTVREIVHNNWDILGQSTHTEYIYKKKLVVWYKCPKNLRVTLIHAGIPRLQEFTYDSDAEREGRHRDSDLPPPPYDADTELAEYTAVSDKLRAEAVGARDDHASSPSSAFAQRRLLR